MIMNIFFSTQGQPGEMATATRAGPPGNPGPKGVTGERGTPGFSGPRMLFRRKKRIQSENSFSFQVVFRVFAVYQAIQV
jgi:hypothetical protein